MTREKRYILAQKVLEVVKKHFGEQSEQFAETEGLVLQAAERALSDEEVTRLQELCGQEVAHAR